MNGQQGTVLLIGRILMSTIFLISGLGKIGMWDMNVKIMEAKGLPLVPLLLAITIVLEVAGALSLLLGFKTRYGAAALLLFLVPVTLIMHNFWSQQGEARMMDMVNFLKNLALIGGLLFPLMLGAGSRSLDARRANARVSYRVETA